MIKHITPPSRKHIPGQTVYEHYLHTEALLALQTPEDALTHHDELQFQIVHQVFELWWKECAFELQSIRAALQRFDLPTAVRLLRRVIQVHHVLIPNLRMLETMTPWDFHHFRKILADGAGTDSPGFHMMMSLSPVLWDDVQAVLAHEQVTLLEVYTHGEQQPWLLELMEALTDYDEIFQIFRAQHLKLAQRMIGPGSIGTGGTPMELLARTLNDVFYPELWEIRNTLTELANDTTPVKD